MTGREIIDRLEKLTGPDREVDFDMHEVVWHSPEDASYWDRRRANRLPGDYDATPAYTASLDAIVALIEQKLPGWRVDCLQHQREGYWSAALRFDGGTGTPPRAWGTGHTHAIALCIALLRALSGDGHTQ